MWQQLQAEEQPTGTSGQRSKAAIKRARKKSANQAATAEQNKQAARRAAEPAAAGAREAHDQAPESEQQLTPQPAANTVAPQAAAITAQSSPSGGRLPTQQSTGATAATAGREWLRCPLSGSFMRDPVLFGGEGHSFEREALEEWLAANPGVDPLSRQPLPPESSGAMLPNHALRNMIQQMHLAKSA
jgi:U-box domain